jgi:hypothetical protein
MKKLPWYLVFFKAAIIKVVDPLIRNRLLHVPDGLLVVHAQKAGVTPQQWRAVEQAQQDDVTATLNAL